MEREYALGYVPGPSDDSLDIREFSSTVNAYHSTVAEAVRTRARIPSTYPPTFDWRNVSGKTFITPIRDQGNCGACVAFGCVAAVEAAVLIKNQSPDQDFDLSEAHLFYCHPNVPSNVSCESGWYPDAALTSLLNPGVVDESCYPYTPGDQPCRVCQDWQNRVTKITRWQKLSSHADMKSWISKRGPTVTCFSVYDDFFHYKSGVYHHVSGSLAGGHCVCCVGYDDNAQNWICKNSWGTAWGENGFFRIQYGQVGIDSLMWAISL